MTAPTPKRHHVVPRFYLERFTDPEGHVWTFDKFTDKVFATSPSKVARESGFYEAPALSPEIDQTVMEDMLSELESDASPIIARWVEFVGHAAAGTTVIEPADRETISLYLATQAFRTSEVRVLLKQGLGDKLEAEDLQTFHVAMLADEVINEAAAAVSDFVWTLARNESEVTFYTSDHPVVLRTHDHRCLHFFQFPRPGTEVLLPLSSTVMFYAYERSHWHKLAPFDGQVSPVRFTRELVESDNQAQIGHSRRFVFCDRDEFAFARSFCAAHPEVRDQERDRFQR
jgi:hypothetical protein